MAVARPNPNDALFSPEEPVTERPEVRRAIADAVAQATSAIRDEIMASLSKPAAIATGGFDAEGLAMALAQLTNQGTGRKAPVSPDVLKFRAEARERMYKLLEEAHDQNLQPEYKLCAITVLDDQRIDPKWIGAPHEGQKDTEIVWPGVPNDAMIPQNDVAKEIFKAFKDSNSHNPRESLGVPEGLNKTWLNHGGLVVRAGKATTPEVGGPDNSTDNGLRVKHRSVPGQAKQIHITGTIAAPAVQLG